MILKQKISKFKIKTTRNSNWSSELRLSTFTAVSLGSILDQETKIPQGMQDGKKS